MIRMTRFSAGVAASAGLALTGLGLSEHSAQAVPNAGEVTLWCPGEALPDQGIRWDMTICHSYVVTTAGTGNVPMVDPSGRPVDSWLSADLGRPEPNHAARIAVLLSAGWARNRDGIEQ